MLIRLRRASELLRFTSFYNQQYGTCTIVLYNSMVHLYCVYTTCIFYTGSIYERYNTPILAPHTRYTQYNVLYRYRGTIVLHCFVHCIHCTSNVRRRVQLYGSMQKTLPFCNGLLERPWLCSLIGYLQRAGAFFHFLASHATHQKSPQSQTASVKKALQSKIMRHELVFPYI